MRIELLGGFVVDRDGRRLAAGAWRLRKARTLVKLLALAPDQRLHRDVLLETLWPDRDRTSAMNNLHQALHVARRVLAGDGSSDGLLEARDDVVALHAGGLIEVDVRCFEQLAALARSSGGLIDLRAAVAAYTGDLLPDDRFEEWAARPREELRLGFGQLLVDFAETAAAAAEDSAALEALQRALTIDPVNERAVRALMRLHAAAGRRSEALASYEQLRNGLRMTYGTDPDPATRRLYRDLLTDTVETDTVDTNTVDAPPKQAPRPRHNLGPPLTSFVGRHREMDDVRRLLGRARLLTLTGVGGAGKTRLAEEIAWRLVDSYPDGVWVADLVPVGAPHLVADTVAAALGLDPAAGPDPVRTLVSRLSAQKLLVVLDNCEHLLTACASLAEALCRHCPGVTILATSREPLRVRGEVTFRVPSLELPEPADVGDPIRLAHLSSVRLFVDRAKDVRPDFDLDPTNAASIVEICRRLDGIPLALELAAARVSHLEPAEIADRLGEALSVLGRRGEITRHATLRAAIEWSHALLCADEQVLLRRLSVFAGSFSLASAEQVCADRQLAPTDILDCLGRLVDKSLVQVEHAGRRSRYRLLETIRQLGRERLVAARELEQLDTAHCRHFLDLAIEHDPDRGVGAVERPQQLDVDHDNLRAALSWALRNDHDRALLLAVSLWRYWLARGHFVEGAGWLTRVLDVSAVVSRDRARALIALAVLDARRGLSERLPELAEASVAIARQCGDAIDVASARILGGTLLLSSATLDEVERTADAVFADAGSVANPVAAAARWLAGMSALFREDVQLARDRFTDCLHRLGSVESDVTPFFPAVTLSMPLIPVGPSLYPVFEESWLLGRRVGAMQGRGYAMSALADAHRLAGELDAALEAARACVEVFTRIDDAAGLALALNHLGCVERDRRMFDPAEQHLRQALRIREELGDRRSENLTLANLGLTRAAADDVDEGRRLARLALDRSVAVEDGPGVAGALLNLAIVELFAGDRPAARRFAEQAVQAYQPQGYLRLEAWACLLAAELAADGDAPALLRYGSAAAGLFGRVGCRIGAQRVAALPLPVR